jgi:hypothetical protein
MNHPTSIHQCTFDFSDLHPLSFPTTRLNSISSAEGGVVGLSGIESPGVNDALFGRGGHTNYHVGTGRFRCLAEQHKDEYISAESTEDRKAVARKVVAQWRAQNPPGRFLTKSDPSSNGGKGFWRDVGDNMAMRRATKILGEKSKKTKAASKTSQKKRSRDEPSDAAPASPPTKKEKMPHKIVDEVLSFPFSEESSLRSLLPTRPGPSALRLERLEAPLFPDDEDDDFSVFDGEDVLRFTPIEDCFDNDEELEFPSLSVEDIPCSLSVQAISNLVPVAAALTDVFSFDN